jgi:hypothetical protein
MLMSGPRTSTLGTESPLTCNYIAKSGGGDHLYDSCIIDDGTTVCVNANLKGTGTISGTDIYASTVSCSPVGCFTTLCTEYLYPYNISMGNTFIRANGNKLGIGTGNPLGVLSITGGQNSLSSLATYSSIEPLGIFNMFYINSGTYPFYLDIAAIGDTLLTNGGSNIRFLTHCGTANATPVERMRISNCGQVGIGTTPVDTLDVMGSLRIRCNTPNFTAVCNSLVIDYVNTCIFGSSPMARYYSIGCTGVSAGHTFTIGTPTSPVNALTINGNGMVGINTDNFGTNTVGNGLILRASSSNAGQTALVIQDYRKCNRWAVNGQTFANDATLTIYSTPNNTNDYTPVFSITQNGQIQRPCSAAFHATINTSTNIGIGGRVIQFNCVLYNAGGAYDGGTSVFTAPVSGLYQFNFVFLNQNTQNVTGGHSYLSTNFGVGTYYFQRYGNNSAICSTGYGGYVPMHGAVAVYLPSGCKACVGAFWDADGAFTHNSTAWASFSGYLVG